MNSSTNIPSVPAADTVAPPQTNRLSISCDLHPDEHFSVFCPSCLCERLSVLDQNNNINDDDVKSSSRKTPTISAASLKALFKNGSSNASTGNGRLRPNFFPELRRSKSFSASKNNNEGLFTGVFEPQRRSCDVKLRSSLWNLFSQDEQRNVVTREGIVSGGKTEEEPRKSSVREEPVLEVSEEEAESEEEQENGGYFDEVVSDSGEIVEEENVIREEEMKPMKDYMDLDSRLKKTPVRDLAGSFWSAASVFSKKLQKWKQKQKQKQKLKKMTGGDGGGRPPLPVEKSNGRQLRDTQSEVADYGFGRRSSDTDPRFSLDAGRFSVDIGRVSVDNARYSFDEPRASWDGYLFGRTTLQQARVPPPPSMLSVVENAPAHRSDMQIPVDDPQPPSINSESDPIIMIPGGSTQTRDYYTGPPSRRRKSFDRSNSIRKTAAATVVTAENDEVKPVPNLKVSTAVTIDSNSTEAAENNGIFREYAASGDAKESQNGNKKSKRWTKWSILGFVFRKGGVNKSGEEDEEEEDRNSRSNSTGIVERSLSEPWSDLRNGGGRMLRSNSSKSWRSSGSGSARKVVNGGGGLETNRSWRYSPKDRENGMLRFYLTPMRSSWRRGGSSGGGGGSGGGWEKTAARANSHGHSIARNVMRLY